MDVFTPELRLRLRAIGSPFPKNMTNGWAQTINSDLETIDFVVAKHVDAATLLAIREELEEKLKFFGMLN